MKLKRSSPPFHSRKSTYQGFIDIQAIHHEKPTLEARKVTKFLRRDTTFSNDNLQATPNQSSSYLHHQRRIWFTMTPQIYILKERRCLNLFTKEDRQPRNRFSLLFHISPAILPSTNVREVHLVNHKLPFTDI